MKPCPFCSEQIQEEAIKCRFCGEFLDGAPLVDVVLTGIARRRDIHVIKSVRSILGSGLGETKDLTEHLPARIAVGLARAKAHEIKTTLEAAGAVVELQSSGGPPRAGEQALDAERVARLSNSGGLSDEEAARLRASLAMERGNETVRLLESLHELHQRGVLSESEFRMKKWELLSHL